jgi:hypothetical protein
MKYSLLLASKILQIRLTLSWHGKKSTMKLEFVSLSLFFQRCLVGDSVKILLGSYQLLHLVKNMLILELLFMWQAFGGCGEL